MNVTIQALDSPLYTPQLRATLGSVVLGGFISVFLSGIVTMQVYLYYRLYMRDAMYLKAIVSSIWLLDILHTVMVNTSNWTYLIANFGNAVESDHITWSVGVTIALTAIITFVVHCFFTNRIHTVSKSNWFITIPLFVLSLFRLGIALATTVEMIKTASYEVFVQSFKWMFTLGLVASAILDIVIACGLSFYLRQSKSGFSSMDQIIDVLILYTVETGLVTCITTIVSLICWLAMSHNLVYLGLHFTISKLYANSFMATLNSRKGLKARSQASQSDKDKNLPMPILFPSRRRYTSRRDVNPLSSRAMEISVQRTVHREIDGETVDVDVDVSDVDPTRTEDDRSSDKRDLKGL